MLMNWGREDRDQLKAQIFSSGQFQEFACAFKDKNKML
uniref:Uncharacterized protein n=1 Tax=Anguilla anguilla TaxID=7936 RepID=A0A0E9RWV6_ANGAN